MMSIFYPKWDIRYLEYHEHNSGPVRELKSDHQNNKSLNSNPQMLSLLFEPACKLKLDHQHMQCLISNPQRPFYESSGTLSVSLVTTRPWLKTRLSSK